MRRILLCVVAHVLIGCYYSASAFAPTKWQIGGRPAAHSIYTPSTTSSCRHSISSPTKTRPFFAKESSSSSSSSLKEDDDESTVCTLTSPSGQIITLIGTAHLSQRSNEQVKRLIDQIQPDVVMVELDPSRLHRIGIKSVDDIDLERVVTSQDIALPASFESTSSTIWNPFQLVTDVIVEAFTRVSRLLLTGMYKNMSKDIIGNENGSGGEFLVAIRAAEACPSCHTLVLGDRSSLTTIRRAALLAMKSGDPLGVLNRLQQSNAEEMEQLETRVRNDLRMAANNKEVDQSDVQLAMMETLKVDTQFRNRLFLKLEQQVPEFTQAFLKERDYLMSESIRRELDLLSTSSSSTSRSTSNSKTVQHVVGVVGLAHVPGMEVTLRAMFSEQAMPLLVVDNE